MRPMTRSAWALSVLCTVGILLAVHSRVAAAQDGHPNNTGGGNVRIRRHAIFHGDDSDLDLSFAGLGESGTLHGSASSDTGDSTEELATSEDSRAHAAFTSWLDKAISVSRDDGAFMTDNMRGDHGVKMMRDESAQAMLAVVGKSRARGNGDQPSPHTKKPRVDGHDASKPTEAPTPVPPGTDKKKSDAVSKADLREFLADVSLAHFGWVETDIVSLPAGAVSIGEHAGFVSAQLVQDDPFDDLTVGPAHVEAYIQRDEKGKSIFDSTLVLCASVSLFRGGLEEAADQAAAVAEDEESPESKNDLPDPKDSTKFYDQNSGRGAKKDDPLAKAFTRRFLYAVHFRTIISRGTVHPRLGDLKALVDKGQETEIENGGDDIGDDDDELLSQLIDAEVTEASRIQFRAPDPKNNPSLQLMRIVLDPQSGSYVDYDTDQIASVCFGRATSTRVWDEGAVNYMVSRAMLGNKTRGMLGVKGNADEFDPAYLDKIVGTLHASLTDSKQVTWSAIAPHSMAIHVNGFARVSYSGSGIPLDPAAFPTPQDSTAVQVEGHNSVTIPLSVALQDILHVSYAEAAAKLYWNPSEQQFTITLSSTEGTLFAGLQMSVAQVKAMARRVKDWIGKFLSGGKRGGSESGEEMQAPSKPGVAGKVRARLSQLLEQAKEFLLSLHWPETGITISYDIGRLMATVAEWMMRAIAGIKDAVGALSFDKLPAIPFDWVMDLFAWDRDLPLDGKHDQSISTRDRRAKPNIGGAVRVVKDKLTQLFAWLRGLRFGTFPDIDLPNPSQWWDALQEHIQEWKPEGWDPVTIPIPHSRTLDRVLDALREFLQGTIPFPSSLVLQKLKDGAVAFFVRLGDKFLALRVDVIDLVRKAISKLGEKFAALKKVFQRPSSATGSEDGARPTPDSDSSSWFDNIGYEVTKEGLLQLWDVRDKQGVRIAFDLTLLLDGVSDADLIPHEVVYKGLVFKSTTETKLPSPSHHMTLKGKDLASMKKLWPGSDVQSLNALTVIVHVDDSKSEDLLESTLHFLALPEMKSAKPKSVPAAKAEDLLLAEGPIDTDRAKDEEKKIEAERRKPRHFKLAVPLRELGKLLERGRDALQSVLKVKSAKERAKRFLFETLQLPAPTVPSDNDGEGAQQDQGRARTDPKEPRESGAPPANTADLLIAASAMNKPTMQKSLVLRVLLGPRRKESSRFIAFNLREVLVLLGEDRLEMVRPCAADISTGSLFHLAYAGDGMKMPSGNSGIPSKKSTAIMTGDKAKEIDLPNDVARLLHLSNKQVSLNVHAEKSALALEVVLKQGDRAVGALRVSLKPVQEFLAKVSRGLKCLLGRCKKGEQEEEDEEEEGRRVRKRSSLAWLKKALAALKNAVVRVKDAILRLKFPEINLEIGLDLLGLVRRALVWVWNGVKDIRIPIDLIGYPPIECFGPRCKNSKDPPLEPPIKKPGKGIAKILDKIFGWLKQFLVLPPLPPRPPKCAKCPKLPPLPKIPRVWRKFGQMWRALRDRVIDLIPHLPPISIPSTELLERLGKIVLRAMGKAGDYIAGAVGKLSAYIVRLAKGGWGVLVKIGDRFVWLAASIGKFLQGLVDQFKKLGLSDLFSKGKAMVDRVRVGVDNQAIMTVWDSEKPKNNAAFDLKAFLNGVQLGDLVPVKTQFGSFIFEPLTADQLSKYEGKYQEKVKFDIDSDSLDFLSEYLPKGESAVEKGASMVLRVDLEDVPNDFSKSKLHFVLKRPKGWKPSSDKGAKTDSAPAASATRTPSSAATGDDTTGDAQDLLVETETSTRALHHGRLRDSDLADLLRDDPVMDHELESFLNVHEPEVEAEKKEAPATATDSAEVTGDKAEAPSSKETPGRFVAYKLSVELTAIGKIVDKAKEAGTAVGEAAAKRVVQIKEVVKRAQRAAQAAKDTPTSDLLLEDTESASPVPESAQPSSDGGEASKPADAGAKSKDKADTVNPVYVIQVNINEKSMVAFDLYEVLVAALKGDLPTLRPYGVDVVFGGNRIAYAGTGLELPSGNMDNVASQPISIAGKDSYEFDLPQEVQSIFHRDQAVATIQAQKLEGASGKINPWAGRFTLSHGNKIFAVLQFDLSKLIDMIKKLLGRQSKSPTPPPERPVEEEGDSWDLSGLKDKLKKLLLGIRLPGWMVRAAIDVTRFMRAVIVWLASQMGRILSGLSISFDWLDFFPPEIISWPWPRASDPPIRELPPGSEPPKVPKLPKLRLPEPLKKALRAIADWIKSIDFGRVIEAGKRWWNRIRELLSDLLDWRIPPIRIPVPKKMPKWVQKLMDFIGNGAKKAFVWVAKLARGGFAILVKIGERFIALGIDLLNWLKKLKLPSWLRFGPEPKGEDEPVDKKADKKWQRQTLMDLSRSGVVRFWHRERPSCRIAFNLARLLDGFDNADLVPHEIDTDNCFAGSASSIAFGADIAQLDGDSDSAELNKPPSPLYVVAPNGPGWTRFVKPFGIPLADAISQHLDFGTERASAGALDTTDAAKDKKSAKPKSRKSAPKKAKVSVFVHSPSDNDHTERTGVLVQYPYKNPEKAFLLDVARFNLQSFILSLKQKFKAMLPQQSAVDRDRSRLELDKDVGKQAGGLGFKWNLKFDVSEHEDKAVPKYILQFGFSWDQLFKFQKGTQLDWSRVVPRIFAVAAPWGKIQAGVIKKSPAWLSKAKKLDLSDKLPEWVDDVLHGGRDAKKKSKGAAKTKPSAGTAVAVPTPDEKKVPSSKTTVHFAYDKKLLKLLISSVRGKEQSGIELHVTQEAISKFVTNVREGLEKVAKVFSAKRTQRKRAPKRKRGEQGLGMWIRRLREALTMDGFSLTAVPATAQVIGTGLEKFAIKVQWGFAKLLELILGGLDRVSQLVPDSFMFKLPTFRFGLLPISFSKGKKKLGRVIGKTYNSIAKLPNMMQSLFSHILGFANCRVKFYFATGQEAQQLPTGDEQIKVEGDNVPPPSKYAVRVTAELTQHKTGVVRHVSIMVDIMAMIQKLLPDRRSEKEKDDDRKANGKCKRFDFDLDMKKGLTVQLKKPQRKVPDPMCNGKMSVEMQWGIPKLTGIALNYENILDDPVTLLPQSMRATVHGKKVGLELEYKELGKGGKRSNPPGNEIPQEWVRDVLIQFLPEKIADKTTVYIDLPDDFKLDDFKEDFIYKWRGVTVQVMQPNGKRIHITASLLCSISILVKMVPYIGQAVRVFEILSGIITDNPEDIPEQIWVSLKSLPAKMHYESYLTAEQRLSNFGQALLFGDDLNREQKIGQKKVLMAMQDAGLITEKNVQEMQKNKGKGSKELQAVFLDMAYGMDQDKLVSKLQELKKLRDLAEENDTANLVPNPAAIKKFLESPENAGYNAALKFTKAQAQAQAMADFLGKDDAYMKAEFHKRVGAIKAQWSNKDYWTAQGVKKANLIANRWGDKLFEMAIVLKDPPYNMKKFEPATLKEGGVRTEWLMEWVPKYTPMAVEALITAREALAKTPQSDKRDAEMKFITGLAWNKLMIRQGKAGGKKSVKKAMDEKKLFAKLKKALSGKKVDDALKKQGLKIDRKRAVKKNKVWHRLLSSSAGQRTAFGLRVNKMIQSYLKPLAEQSEAGLVPHWDDPKEAGYVHSCVEAQKATKVRVDGVCGPRTWYKLVKKQGKYGHPGAPDYAVVMHLKRILDKLKAAKKGDGAGLGDGTGKGGGKGKCKAEDKSKCTDATSTEGGDGTGEGGSGSGNGDGTGTGGDGGPDLGDLIDEADAPTSVLTNSLLKQLLLNPTVMQTDAEGKLGTDVRKGWTWTQVAESVRKEFKRAYPKKKNRILKAPWSDWYCQSLDVSADPIESTGNPAEVAMLDFELVLRQFGSKRTENVYHTAVMNRDGNFKVVSGGISNYLFRGAMTCSDTQPPKCTLDKKKELRARNFLITIKSHSALKYVPEKWKDGELEYEDYIQVKKMVISVSTVLKKTTLFFDDNQGSDKTSKEIELSKGTAKDLTVHDIEIPLPRNAE